jgi:hypothetical protein
MHLHWIEHKLGEIAKAAAAGNAPPPAARLLSGAPAPFGGEMNSAGATHGRA